MTIHSTETEALIAKLSEPEFELTEVDPMEQALVLGGLLEATGQSMAKYDEALRLLTKAQKSAPVVDILQIARILNLAPEKQMPNTKKEFNRRQLLDRAYPNYPTKRFSSDYLEAVYTVLPGLMRANQHLFSEADSSLRLENHIRRMELWAQGLLTREIAQREWVDRQTIHDWWWTFPIYLKSTVSYYELVHAADELGDLWEQAIDASSLSAKQE